MDKRIIWGKHSYGQIHIEGRIRSQVVIGKYTSIGLNVTAFMVYDHVMSNISTYPFGHDKMAITKLINSPISRKNYMVARKLRVNIGNDVWIGSNSVIFTGVTIGDGAVIGAYSTITKDVPPYAIVVGNDRVIRKRFTDKDIDFLLKLKWWDKTDEEVAELAPILLSSDIGALR